MRIPLNRTSILQGRGSAVAGKIVFAWSIHNLESSVGKIESSSDDMSNHWNSEGIHKGI